MFNFILIRIPFILAEIPSSVIVNDVINESKGVKQIAPCLRLLTTRKMF